MSSFLHISIIIWQGGWFQLGKYQEIDNSKWIYYHTRIPEWSLIFRPHLRPLQPLLNNKIHHCAILLFQLIDVFSIPSQIWRKASEAVKAIGSFRWTGSATCYEIPYVRGWVYVYTLAPPPTLHADTGHLEHSLCACHVQMSWWGIQGIGQATGSLECSWARKGAAAPHSRHLWRMLFRRTCIGMFSIRYFRIFDNQVK